VRKTDVEPGANRSNSACLYFEHQGKALCSCCHRNGSRCYGNVIAGVRRLRQRQPRSPSGRSCVGRGKGARTPSREAWSSANHPRPHGLCARVGPVGHVVVHSTSTGLGPCGIQRIAANPNGIDNGATVLSDQKRLLKPNAVFFVPARRESSPTASTG